MAHFSKRGKGKNNKNKANSQSNSTTNQFLDNKDVILKASDARGNEDLATSRVRKSQLTYPALKVIAGQIDENHIKDLTYPQAFCTYSEMLADTTVRTAVDLKKTLLWIPLKNYRIVAGRNQTTASKNATKFVNYCFNNMDQSWYDVCNNLLSYNKWGFSIAEKVYKKIPNGEYEGRLGIGKLSPVSPKSIDEWVFSKDMRNLLGFNQSTAYQSGTSNFFKKTLLDRTINKEAEISVPRNKFMLWSYKSEIGNPEGESPLQTAYRPWKALWLVQDYQLVGVSKDLGGLPLIEVPQEILNKANVDPTGIEAQYINQLAQDAANLHAGDQTYMILPSNTYDGSSIKQYNMTLRGIDGGGKMYQTDDIIKGYQQDILDSFGVGFIRLGSNGSGSYSLAESQTGMHGLMLESDLGFIAEQFNRDLIPQLLALNGITLPEDEMPTLEVGDIDEPSLDEFSKSVQRLAATGMLSKHPKIIRETILRAGYPKDLIDSLSDDDLMDYMDEPTSKSGSGLESGLPNGTGDSTSEGNDRSVSNLEAGGSD